ncbi:membrane protease YdiL (CAAX protease family) [Paenibacillus anaericanus]|uniref:CPBP family intramembrane glutamic endopeptidase n=1 Tax=Paenibacillus anaericanus TaxID=170367 RepID=UPI00277D6934|nr:CPBP family intramembrane glutamic endopeptidase [Paenibacillus anaericanus]MDQ0089466.1 membrane protease YdiL (CAAX protease family) [Paenibacillus anaericanus]
MDKKTIQNIVIFVLVVIFSGWIGVLVDSVLTDQPKGDTLGMGIWLVLPMLTAFAIIIFSKGSWKDVGFKLNLKGNMKWYLTSVLIFPVVTAIILVIGATTKWIDLSALNLKVFVGVFLGTLIINFIKNIFEETVWRGFLTSQLIKLNLKDWKLYLIVGSVWGIWHVPYYLFFLSGTDMQAVLPVNRSIFVVVAVITMICWSVMYTELYRVTKSIWPCVILHMVEDSLINPLVISGYISIAAGKEIFVSPISGIITTILYLAVGLGIRAYRRQYNSETIIR